MEFKLKFDYGDKILDPTSYNFIPSIKYSEQISNCCGKLKELTGIEYFSLCIEYSNQRFYLSNNPGNIAIPYYIRNLYKIDCSFSNVEKSYNSTFYPKDNYEKTDCLSSLFIDLLENEFKVYNYYGMVRKYNGYTLTVVLGGSHPTDNNELLFKNTQDNTKNFTVDFIKDLKWIFQENASWLKHSKLFNKHNFIYNLLNNTKTEYHELSYGEIGCLYWYKEGKSTKEIAQITKYSPLTVSSYFKSIKEKLKVESTQQAMLIAIQKGWIS